MPGCSPALANRRSMPTRRPIRAQGREIIAPPGSVFLVTGVNGRPENFGVVRFTAPSNGNYEISAAVAPMYTGGLAGDTDFHVVRNGVELFGQFLAPHATAAYTNIVALNTGDAIDFAMGRGADGNQDGSTLRLAALITPVAMTNLPPPLITEHPESRFALSGQSILLVVSGTGGGLTYQWFHNGTPKPGATLAVLTLPHVNRSDAGTYFAVVSNAGGSVTSQVSTVTVNAERTLAVISPGDAVEGAVVSVPLGYGKRRQRWGNDVCIAIQCGFSFLARSSMGRGHHQWRARGERFNAWTGSCRVRPKRICRTGGNAGVGSCKFPCLYSPDKLHR